MSVKDWRGNYQEQMNCLFNIHDELLETLNSEIEELTEKEAKMILFKTVMFAKEMKKEVDKFQEVKGALWVLKRFKG